MKVRIKTPISYYGGKQNLLGTILPLIPDHDLYCEPFCGGAAVFWAKDQSKVEVINDINQEVINFYRVVQRQFEPLFELVQATLHSRKLHEDAAVIYKHPHMFSEVDRAWAFWIQCNQSFSSKITGGWAYGRKGNSCEKKTSNAKAKFAQVFHDRLKHVQIECNNALTVIQSRDMETAFHYVDPPYPETDMGHYGGYTMDNFCQLLEVLAGIKGKFLLSSYDYPQLRDFAAKNGLFQVKKVMIISAVKGKRDKLKTEVLTANYPLG